MGELNNVLRSIADHCSIEGREHYRNLSIGRGEMMMTGMRAPSTIWIVNNDLAPTHGVARDITGAAVTAYDSGRKDTFSESGTIAVPKNREFARILLQNYEGHHSCVFMNRQRKDFLIRSSAHYTNTSGNVSNIHIGVAGMKSWSVFASLRQALQSLNEVDETIRQNKIREEEAKRKAEELRKKQQEEAARKAEEEARKLKEEIDAAQAKREAILSEASKAAEFIRKQVRSCFEMNQK